LNHPRQALRKLAEERGHSLAHLSVLLGRNITYLNQFCGRRSPRRLADDDRLHLAKYLNCDERLLGARDPWQPVSL
jgi:repressor LexA